MRNVERKRLIDLLRFLDRVGDSSWALMCERYGSELVHDVAVSCGLIRGNTSGKAYLTALGRQKLVLMEQTEKTKASKPESAKAVEQETPQAWGTW